MAPVLLIAILLTTTPLLSNSLYPPHQQSPQATLKATVESQPTLMPLHENPVITTSRADEIRQISKWQGHPDDNIGVSGLSFSPDQIHLVSTGSTMLQGSTAVHMWDVRGNPVERFFSDLPSFVDATTTHYSPDGQYIMVHMGGNAVIWKVKDGTLAARIRQAGSIASVFAGDSHVAVVSENGLIGFWKLPPQLPDPGSEGMVMLGNPGSAELGWLGFSDLGGTLLTAFQVGNPLVEVAVDSRNGLVFGLAQNGRLSIFDQKLADGTPQTIEPGTVTGTTESIGNLIGPRIALKPNNSIVAFASSNHDVIVWNYADRSIVNRYHLGAPINCVMFSPNGELLVIIEQAVESMIHVVDANSGESFAVLNANSSVRSCAFSPNGTLFATGSMNGEIRLWGLSR
jgi:WD40 repeat protein